VVEATVNIFYQVDYNATDIDSPLSQLSWVLNTNATWLSIDATTGVLSGTPSESDLGWYNVNITVNDGDEGLDWREFILTVYIGNLPPKIITENLDTAYVNKYYMVDYNATDDEALNLLSWSLETNASWLNIYMTTGVLSGTPSMNDIGSYWVNVSVFDIEDGRDFTNFTLFVISLNITIYEPKLSNPSVTPASGDTETIFTFSVDYSHPKGYLPDSIQVVINDRGYDLIFNASSDSYEFSTKLFEGNFTYYFTTILGNLTISTNASSIIVRKAPDIQPEDEEEDNTMLLAGIVIIIIVIIVVLISLLIFFRKKGKGKEEQPPPPAVTHFPESEEEQLYGTTPEVAWDDESDMEE
jgi:hypothetical protein